MAKAIVVAAPASGSGKTLITLGLLRAFRNGGVRVAAAKVGPDYIDPRFHEAATGRPCYNLDAWAMSPSQIKGLVAELARDADLVIIEGVMGLFDGAENAQGSTADLAAATGLPVVLVVGMRLGCLNHALLTRRAIADYGLVCAGWICNSVDRHILNFQENRQALIERLDAPLIGTIPFLDRPEASMCASYLELNAMKVVRGE